MQTPVVFINLVEWLRCKLQNNFVFLVTNKSSFWEIWFNEGFSFLQKALESKNSLLGLIIWCSDFNSSKLFCPFWTQKKLKQVSICNSAYIIKRWVTVILFHLFLLIYFLFTFSWHFFFVGVGVCVCVCAYLV